MTPKMRTNVLWHGSLLVMLLALATLGPGLRDGNVFLIVVGILLVGGMLFMWFVDFASSHCPHCKRFIDLRGGSAYCPKCGKWIPLKLDEPPRT
jgi:hypothetical protein